MKEKLFINTDMDFNNESEDIDDTCDIYTSIFEPIDEAPKFTNINKKYREEPVKFRRKILNAYDYKCAISGETCINVLEAAHIQEYVNENSNNIQNGILLREDIHTLFDDGLISITEDYLIQVSDKIESETYRIFHNKKINLPLNMKYYPSPKALKYKRNKDLNRL